MISMVMAVPPFVTFWVSNRTHEDDCASHQYADIGGEGSEVDEGVEEAWRSALLLMVLPGGGVGWGAEYRLLVDIGIRSCIDVWSISFLSGNAIVKAADAG